MHYNLDCTEWSIAPMQFFRVVLNVPMQAFLPPFFKRFAPNHWDSLIFGLGTLFVQDFWLTKSNISPIDLCFSVALLWLILHPSVFNHVPTKQQQLPCTSCHHLQSPCELLACLCHAYALCIQWTIQSSNSHLLHSTHHHCGSRLERIIDAILETTHHNRPKRWHACRQTNLCFRFQHLSQLQCPCQPQHWNVHQKQLHSHFKWGDHLGQNHCWFHQIPQIHCQGHCWLIHPAPKIGWQTPCSQCQMSQTHLQRDNCCLQSPQTESQFHGCKRCSTVQSTVHDFWEFDKHCFPRFRQGSSFEWHRNCFPMLPKWPQDSSRSELLPPKLQCNSSRPQLCLAQVFHHVLQFLVGEHRRRGWAASLFHFVQLGVKWLSHTLSQEHQQQCGQKCHDDGVNPSDLCHFHPQNQYGSKEDEMAMLQMMQFHAHSPK